jgi:hypothetical protein
VYKNNLDTSLSNSKESLLKNIFLKISIVFFLSLLLLLATQTIIISALSISDVQPTVDNRDLTFIKLQQPQQIAISFTIHTSLELTAITANYSSLNPTPSLQQSYSEINLLENCRALPYNQSAGENPKGYFCSSQLQLLPQTPQLNIQYLVSVYTQETQETITETFNRTLHFTIDNTNPELRSISSTNCHEGICYVGNRLLNVFNFEVEDSVGSFYQRKLFFNVANQATTRVFNCTSQLCQGRSLVYCNSQETVRLELSSLGGMPSSDDAGNFFVGVSSKEFVCDEFYPEPENLNVKAVNIPYQGIFKEGDTLDMWVLVKEDSPGLQATINLTSLTGASQLQEGRCSMISRDLYNCTWTIPGVKSGNHELEFQFTDVVGRTSISMQELFIDEYITHEEGQEELPDIFADITATSSAPAGYNRVAMHIAQSNGVSYPISSTFTMQKIYSGTVETLLLNIDSFNCMYVVGSEQRTAAQGFDIKIANPLTPWDEGNSVIINLLFGSQDFGVNQIDSSFSLICNATAIVRVDEQRVYQTPDTFQINIPIQFRNSALGSESPGQRLATAIKEKEDSLNTGWRIIESLNKIYASLTSLCLLEGTSILSQNTGVLMSLGGQALEAAGLPVGNTVKDLGRTFALSSGKISEDERTGKEFVSTFNKWLTKACEYTKCNTAEKMQKNNSLNSWWLTPEFTKDFTGDNLAGLISNQESDGGLGGIWADTSSELFENIEVPNVKESMITSVVTMCVPGMLYHLNHIREAHCQNLICLKQASAYGMDIEVCDLAMSQFYCEKVVGELFEIPGVRQVRNFVDNVNSFVQNIIPNTLKIVTKNTFCKDILANCVGEECKNDISFNLCYIPQSIGKALNYVDKASSSSETFYYESEFNYCEIALERPQGDIFEQLTGIKIPPNIDTYLGKNDRILATKVRDLFNQATTAGSKDSQAQEAIKELENIGFLKNNLDNSDYLASQINLLNNVIRLDPSATISVGADGKILMTLSEFANFGSYYEQAQQSCSNTLIIGQSSNPDINNYIDSYAKEQDVNLVYYGRKTINVNNLKPSVNYSNTLVEQNNKQRVEDIKRLIDTCNQAHTSKVTQAKEYINRLEGYLSNNGLCSADPLKSQSPCVEWKTYYERFKVTSSNNQEEIDNYNECVDGCYDIDDLLILGSPSNYAGCVASCGLNPSSSSGSEAISNDIIIKSNTNNDFSLKKIENFYQEQRSIERSNAIRRNVQNTMDLATLTAAKNGVFDFLNLRYYSPDSTLGKISSAMDAFVSTDAYKTSLCSPYTMKADSLASNHGSAIDCRDGICTPVLSFAGERVKMTNGSYLYTFVYHIGGAQYEMGGGKNEIISFMPRFKSGSGSGVAFLDLIDERFFNQYVQEPRGSTQERSYDSSWLELLAKEIYSNKHVFVSDTAFNELCMVFNTPYPPASPRRKTEYCRDIFIVEDGDLAWDTGAPTIPEDYEVSEEDAFNFLGGGRLSITV